MSTDVQDYGEQIARIENLLRGRLVGQPRYDVADALDEDTPGVLALAEKLSQNAKLDNPLAVFISAIRRGDHVNAAAQGVERLRPVDAFRKFFDEYREWLADVCELDDNRAIEYALDYAVCSMTTAWPTIEGHKVKIGSFPRGMTPLTLEDEMRASLGRPRPHTTGEERTRMGTEWVIIAASLHSPRIAAMHNALMEQCAIPREPTHDEARLAREALVAEIRALGVKPAPLPAPPAVDGFATIGDAVASIWE